MDSGCRHPVDCKTQRSNRQRNLIGLLALRALLVEEQGAGELSRRVVQLVVMARCKAGCDGDLALKSLL